MEPSCDQESSLCDSTNDSTTELTASKPSRRLLPELKIPTVVTMARKRRIIHALFGILVGFLTGFLFLSRSSFTNLGYLVVNGTCSTKNTWPKPNYYHIPSAIVEDNPLSIIQMTDPGETIHNSRKALLFVGVMTAQKYLDTRAVAVYETWGREIPGRIAFFSAAVSTSPLNKPDLPLVRLQGVDDSYPPQKKSFLMLQYMWEHYGDRFEWFVRADDDVYVRPDKLELLLRSIDSRKPQYIGQAGRGNQEEFGLLSLEYDENFCMGGPGIIMSRETLARVAPHIKYCLKNLYTTHEDVELGRCVQKFAGIPCTWSYEMQSILYHNSSGADAFTGNLKLKEVHRAISLHPVKQHQHMYRIHNYMKALKIQELQHQSVALHRDVASMMKMLGRTPDDAQNMMLTKQMPLFPDRQGSRQYLGDTAKLGLQPGLNKYRPSTVDEVIPWDFISRSLFSADHANPRRRIESALHEGLDDVVREVMDMINMFSKQRGRVIEYREILYGYHRLNPVHGADYILDLLLVYKKYRGRKMTVPVRRHVYLQQQFTGLEIRETFEGVEVQPPSAAEDEHDDEVEEEKEEEARDSTDEDTPEPLQNTLRNAFQEGLLKIGENIPSLLRPRKSNNDKQFRVKDKMINFILPLSGRYETFQRFIKFFEEVCLQNDESVSITLVLFTSNEEETTFNKTLATMNSLSARYPMTPIHVVPVFEPFARARALELGAAQCQRTENLLFFVDVDIVFTRASLQRIRANTIRGKQAYFPIVYSEFDPTLVYAHMGISASPNHFVVNEDTGYWRQYGFGIAAIYKSDLRRVGGLNTTIRGWGKEDVDLFDRVVTSNLTVFRAADPHLVHVFHIVECDPRLDPSQLRMCRGTRIDTYGGVRQLADYIYSHSDVMQFAKNKSKAPS